MTRTIIALDVDGVINSFPRALYDGTPAWDDFQSFWAATSLHGGRKFEITFSPTVIKTLLDFHKSDKAEIHWLTTWGREANDDLSAGVGFPGDFEVAGERPANAAYTPLQTWQVRDGEDKWWKFSAMKRLADANPDARIVWCDDDLAFDSASVAWVKEQGGRVLGICPDTDKGLTPEHLRLIGEFIEKEE